MIFDSTRSLVATSAAILALSLSSAVAAADPPTPGTSCGADRVITSINTCEPLNSSCTGYDSMVIGRVASNGRCVIPGLDGTSW
jgi:hypothetical protein